MRRSTNRPSERKPPAPRLPRFSPARIGLYLFCPRAYWYYYTRGLRWGGMTAGHTFGGNLHRALQAFHERGGAEQVPLEELLADLRERWSEAGFASATEAAEHLEAGAAVLARYHAAAPEPGRTLLWTEKTVQHRYPDFVLFGRVDRLDRRADGSLDVIDYKSGRLTVSEEEVRESLAQRIYQLVLAREHPGVPIHTAIHCLRSGASASVLRTPEELDEVEREVTEVVRAIMRDEQFLAAPGERCAGCVYNRICAPGRQWLAGGA